MRKENMFQEIIEAQYQKKQITRDGIFLTVLNIFRAQRIL